MSDRKQTIRKHADWVAYQSAFDAAMNIFELRKRFPSKETYSLTDQVRPSSRSVCENVAEAWRKRRYPPAFVAKLSDLESAAERQTWIQIAVKCEYLNAGEARTRYNEYDNIIGMLVNMINHPEKWTLPK